MPVGQWIHVEIVCDLGKRRRRHVRPDAHAARRTAADFRPLPCGSGDRFKRLEWLGFVSLAQDKTVFYLDNVKLDPTPAG